MAARPPPALLVALAVVIAGCAGVQSATPARESTTTGATDTPATSDSGPGSSSPADAGASVPDDDARVPPGWSIPVAVEVRNVAELRVEYASAAARDNLTVDGANATLAPSPDSVVDVHPPQWAWDSAQSSVRLTVDVRADANARPGVYHLRIVAWNDAATAREGQPITSASERGATGTVTVYVQNETCGCG